MSYAVERDPGCSWDWRQFLALIILTLCTPLFFFLTVRKIPDPYSLDIIPLTFQLYTVVMVVWGIRYYRRRAAITLGEETCETKPCTVDEFKARTGRPNHFRDRALPDEVIIFQQRCASVNAEIVACFNWNDVLTIVERNWEYCDDVNLVTTLYRIAVLRPLTEAMPHNPIIQKVLLRLCDMVNKSEIRCLSNLVWALAKIPIRLDEHTDLLASVARRSAELIRSMREKGSIVPNVGLKVVPRDVPNAPTPLVARRLQQFNNLLWGFATLRYGDFTQHPTLISNVNSVFIEVSLCPELLPLCNAQEVACIAWAYSRALEMKSPDSEMVSFLRALARCAHQCLGSDSIPRNISMFAWAFHQMKKKVLTVDEMETLLRTLEKPMEDSKDRAKHGKTLPNVTRFHPPTSWKPHQIGLLLMTYAEAKVHSAWFAFFIPRIICTVPAFRPIDFAYVAYAYAISGVHDYRVFSAIYEGMKYQTANLNKNDLMMIVRAFTIVDYKVQEVLKLVSSLGKNEMYSGMKSRDALSSSRLFE